MEAQQGRVTVNAIERTLDAGRAGSARLSSKELAVAMFFENNAGVTQRVGHVFNVLYPDLSFDDVRKAIDSICRKLARLGAAEVLRSTGTARYRWNPLFTLPPGLVLLPDPKPVPKPEPELTAQAGGEATLEPTEQDLDVTVASAPEPEAEEGPPEWVADVDAEPEALVADAETAEPETGVVDSAEEPLAAEDKPAEESKPEPPTGDVADTDSPEGKRDPWTPERIKELPHLWEAGVKTAEMGRRLSLITPEAGPVSKNAVIGKVHRSGLVPRIVKEMSPPRRNLFDFVGPACMWGIGHPGEENFHFCGAQPIAGKPYCQYHSARAYVKKEKPEGALAA